MVINTVLQKEKIVDTLKSQGYANKVIDYNQFLELYGFYKEYMSELEFARIIGLNYDKLKFMRTRGTKSLILKQNASQELIDMIINSLCKKGYINKQITYNELVELYTPYKNFITEKEYAKIIGINDHNYKNIKRSSKSKATILKTKIDSEKISREVESEYGEALITYREFLDIYEKYRNEVNSEFKFAEIVGISYGSYQKIKSSNGKTKLFRIKNVPEKIKNEILNNIKIRCGQINYTQFLELYTPYATLISELQFVRILNISELTLRGMKKNKTSTDICLEEITPKKKSQIIEELRNKGYSNRKILYEEFLKIYQDYKNEIEERSFANLLGISDINYDTIRYKSRKAVILKTEIPCKTESEENRNKKAVDKQTNTKNEDIHDLNNNGINSKDIYEKSIDLFQFYYKQGISDLECIEIVSQKIGLTKIELLEVMKENMIQKQIIKQDSKGKYYVMKK